MNFCKNCGNKLEGDEKFCKNCGIPTNLDINERQQKYVGKIYKCPACGEHLKSFVSHCPSCGFEIRGKKVTSSLEEFIAQVNECDQLIANTPQNKTGWASWGKTKKFFWVVLNLLFFGIPLVIYLVLPLVLINSTPKLSYEEKRMSSIIENFSFPNDRESIIDALIFIKEKIDFISKEKIDRKTAYWERLWCAKAEQLKQKADILFPNDNIVQQSYAKIVNDDERIKKTIKIKTFVGLLILIVAIVFLVIRFKPFNSVLVDDTDYSATFEWQTNGLFVQIPEPKTNNGHIVRESEKQINIELYNISSKDFEEYVKACRENGFTVNITKSDTIFYAHDDEGYDLDIFYDEDKGIMEIYVDSYDISDGTEKKDEDTNSSSSSDIEENSYNTTNIKNFTFNIPNYWIEEGSKNEYLQYYAEKGDKVVMLSIAYPKETDDNYDVSFDGLYADNDNMIEVINKIYTDGDVIDYEVFESDYGVKGILYRFTFNQKINWFQSVDGRGYLFCFPSEKDRRWFNVVLQQTNNVTSDKYKEEYMNLLSSIKEKS